MPTHACPLHFASQLEGTRAVYIANAEFISELSLELGDGSHRIEDVIFSPKKPHTVCFADDIWLEPVIVTFQSISEAVKILKQAGKFWYLHPLHHVRRSRLIEAQLRRYSLLERQFPIETEIPPIGVFGLIDKNTLVYSAKRSKKWPDGICHFVEDRVNPPNRAYLKLWEALSLLEKYPSPTDSVLDLGASPGGWTYVMQSLGATVTAVDKALLDPSVGNLPRVQFLQQSAFALDPAACLGPYDWVLSDIACYPDRALGLIQKWIASGKAKQMIFTIKLQGQIDLATLAPFQAIPNARIQHLYYNKHEVTFFYPAPQPII